MVMVPQSLPKLKRFVNALGLENATERRWVIRLITAFVLQAARMSAVQAAGVIESDPYRGGLQVCRC